MFKRFISSVKKILRKAIVAISALAVIMATAGALVAGLIWSVKIGIIVALCSVGVLLLCLLIDKDAAQEGISKAAETLSKVAETAGSIAGSVVSGVVGGISKSSGFVGLLLLLGGVYVVWSYTSEEKEDLDVKREFDSGNRGISAIDGGSNRRYDIVVSEEKDSEVERSGASWTLDSQG